MHCKNPNCQKELPPKKSGGHRVREYCDNACKQAHYRINHPQKSASIQVVELEGEISHLKYQLEIERRYLEDKEVRGLKPWLEKQPRPSPLMKKLLINIANKRLQPYDTRLHYEYRMHLQKYSEEEMHEFANLWKTMLLYQT